jgi:hypothetical protein
MQASEPVMSHDDGVDTIAVWQYSQVFADEGILAKGYSHIDKGSYQRCEACNTMIFWGDQSLKQRNPYRSYIRVVIRPCTYNADNSISHAFCILCLR